MADAEAPLAVLRLVDQPHHRRVGRDVDPALARPSRSRGSPATQSGRCVLKAFTAWFTSATRSARNSTRFTQLQRISRSHERDHRARLARAGRHHQRAPSARGPARTPRRCGGWRASGSSARRSSSLIARVGQRLAARPPLDQQLQLVLLVEALHGARRIARVVPQPVLVAVGVEDDRPLPELLLQAIGVELRLLLADARGTASCASPRPAPAACRRRPRARSRRSPCPASLGMPVTSNSRSRGWSSGQPPPSAAGR